MGLDSVITLDLLGIQLSLRDIYENVQFGVAPNRSQERFDSLCCRLEDGFSVLPEEEGIAMIDKAIGAGTDKAIADDRAAPAAVLSKATVRAAKRLAIQKGLLGKIVGLSPASVTRLHNGGYQLDPQRKEWDFALLFVRLYRSLDSIVGTDSAAQAWLKGNSTVLNGRPIELITTIQGLVNVVEYLDANRARV